VKVNFFSITAQNFNEYFALAFISSKRKEKPVLISNVYVH